MHHGPRGMPINAPSPFPLAGPRTHLEQVVEVASLSHVYWSKKRRRVVDRQRLGKTTGSGGWDGRSWCAECREKSQLAELEIAAA